jgi:hypothetical protein
MDAIDIYRSLEFDECWFDLFDKADSRSGSSSQLSRSGSFSVDPFHWRQGKKSYMPTVPIQVDSSAR